GLRLREPGRPTPDDVEHDLERPRPSPSPRGLVDRKGAAEREGAVLGHADLDELAGLGLLGDLGRDERERDIGAAPAVREHLAASADHGAIAKARSGPEAVVGSIAAWYSCSDRGAPDAWAASIPCTAASTPGIVVMQGTPARAAAVRMK